MLWIVLWWLMFFYLFQNIGTVFFKQSSLFRFDYWSESNPNNVWRGRSKCELLKNVKCFWGVNYFCTEKHVTCFVYFFKLVLQTCVFSLAGVGGSRVCYWYFRAISVWTFTVRFRLHISRWDFLEGGVFYKHIYFLLTNFFTNVKILDIYSCCFS